MHVYVLTATATMGNEIQALKFGKSHIYESFSRSVELILAYAPSGRVVIMGMGKSGHIGNRIAATLASTLTSSFLCTPLRLAVKTWVW